MDWIWALIAGAFIGWIASMIMKTNAQMGAIANIAAGLIGAMLGRVIAQLLNLSPPGTNFTPMGLLFGVLGACIVIGIWKAISGGRSRVA